MDRERLADAAESFAVVLPARLLVGVTLALLARDLVEVVVALPFGSTVVATLVSPFALAAVGFRPTLPAALAHFLLSQGLFFFVVLSFVFVGAEAVAEAGALVVYAAALSLSWTLAFTDTGRKLRKRVYRRAESVLQVPRGG